MDQRTRRRVAVLVLLAAVPAGGAGLPSSAAPPADATLPPVRGLAERYAVDRDLRGRFDDAPASPGALGRQEAFHRGWMELVEAIDYDALDLEGRIDHQLMQGRLRYELRSIDHERERLEEIATLVPFRGAIVDLHEARRQLEFIQPKAAAEALEAIREMVEAASKAVDDEAREDISPVVANRAAQTVDSLRRTLDRWYAFYAGYDPLFTWWARRPHEQLDPALQAYAKKIRTTLLGADDAAGDEPIVGDPVGRDTLLSMLEYELIPYTPEELVLIAGREYDWCLREMKQAARELGYDDWHDGLEHVKSLHVEPGDQPRLIRDLAWEAIEFLEARDLLTIPPLCRESWRMQMMSPARQKMSPYFLGGETIIVSFPTDAMDHDDKLMSMRGNNEHFARATVHHELIPGHHLQGFMTSRYRTHRRIFSTPFWLEGWALYWEMRLWDLDFPRSAEDRIGMLFWRMHRCARIVFSLSFHLGTMTPEAAIDYLVENVGHERNNATAEVRRSVSGGYGPLYQAAYMLGGLQIRALHDEMVVSGRMTERMFHDHVLRQNAIPIELVRASLTGEALPRDFRSTWRFYGEVDAAIEP